MKKLFIPYKLSVLAKEKGFSEVCFALITEREVYPLNISDTEELTFQQQVSIYNLAPCVPAPMHQQIVDWFREEKKIDIRIFRHYKFAIFNRNGEDTAQYYDATLYTEYYEALNEGIEQAFKLI